jgi:hypothetical protein
MPLYFSPAHSSSFYYLPLPQLTIKHSSSNIILLPVAMSDSAKSPAPASATAATTANFTERELQLLGWAMQSLKSGPPEVGHLTVSP